MPTEPPPNNRSDPFLPGMSMAAGIPATLGGAVDAGIIQCTSQGLVHFVNSVMCAMTGVDKEEIVGRPFQDLDVFPWGKGVLKILVKKALRKNEPCDITRHYIEPDTARSVYWRVAVHPAEKGRFTITIQEVTKYQRLREVFGRLVSPEIIGHILAASERDFLTPERRVISVLFADLRGFTEWSRAAEPEEVHAFLSDFFDLSCGAVKEAGGTVDKFIGDQVMALFGAPLESTTNALSAVRAAERIQREHRALCAAREHDHRPWLAVGVGVATGEAVVGVVGSELHAAYTALGHTVNLAARLCAYAKSGEILVCDATQDAAARQFDGAPSSGPPPVFNRAGTMDLKGIGNVVAHAVRWKGDTAG